MRSRSEGTDEAAAGKMLAAALAYAEAGVPVFPLHTTNGSGGCSCGKARCSAPAKHPLTEHGFHDASTDRETVAAWWARWPDANIGSPTGSASGLVVLDVDVQNGGARTLARLEREHGKLPPTGEILTPNGGRHYVFRHNGRALKSGAGEIGDGLDTRGQGGYRICPPSVGANGRAYKYLRSPEKATPADPPAWLFELLEEQLSFTAAPPVEETIPEGKRRQRLLSVAGSMRRRGLTGDEILPALLELNKRCRPPLGRKEIEELAADVGTRYQPDQRSSVAAVLEASENSIPPPIDKERGGNETESGGELPFAALAPLLEKAPPEPPWLLPGYVARFAVALLAGRPKVGKSTLVCALLADVARGDPFLGLQTSRAGVLLLTEERRDTLAEKARVLGLIRFRHGASPIGGGNELPPVHALMRHDAGATPWPEVVRQAMAYCARHELGLLCVDTFDRWVGLRGDAENAAGAVNEALEPLQYAAAAGLAVLLVSHQRKSSGEFGEAVRGSSALTGGVDVVVELERPSRALELGSHARVLRAVSRFSSTPEELYVELDEHGFVPIESPEQVRADVERDRLLAALDELAEPVTAQLLGEELELPKSTVRRHLRTLLERGLVLRDGGGKKNDPYTWQLAPESPS